MKLPSPFFAVTVALIFTCLTSQASRAQSTPTPAPAPMAAPQSGKDTSLTVEDKAKLAKLRDQVLASNPDLKAEQDMLMKQRLALKAGDASPDEKMAFIQSTMAHQEKVKAAMIKADPSITPLIQEASAEMKQRMQQRAAKVLVEIKGKVLQPR